MTNKKQATIIGGGLTGNLLAICLARHEFDVEVIEAQAEYQPNSKSSGRSINLALAARGIEALKRLEAFESIKPLLIPMTGRALHETDSPIRYTAYGQTDDESIFSVSRSDLNYHLYQLAQKHDCIRYRFDTECVDIDPDTLKPLVSQDGVVTPLESDTVFATDGAGSNVRRSLASLGVLSSHESLLDHSYKELTIAATSDGEFALEPNALHIWPRSEFMLIALANTDKSFTATLFLPNQGDPSFENINESNIDTFFKTQFPDASELFDDLPKQFLANPTGIMGTVRCDTWHYKDRYLLLGDAAHAIVPFHGQGMNAAFEGVRIIDEMLGDQKSLSKTFSEFTSNRIKDTNAIADMAIDNYNEMRDTVLDPKFQLQRSVALELERRLPRNFIPQYSMVMFHPEIPYAQAQARGRTQRTMLNLLIKDIDNIDNVNFDAIEKIVQLELAPIR